LKVFGICINVPKQTKRYENDKVKLKLPFDVPISNLEKVHLKFFISLLFIGSEKVKNDVYQLAELSKEQNLHLEGAPSWKTERCPKWKEQCVYNGKDQVDDVPNSIE
jgi:hypothetical protein